jgi:putative transposase
MRFTQDEKYEIIRLIEDSELGVNRTLGELDISKRTFYNCYGKYTKHGYDGLALKRRAAKSQ